MKRSGSDANASSTFPRLLSDEGRTAAEEAICRRGLKILMAYP
jgi:hypothetical protein